MHKVADLMVREQIIKAVNHYGIEGTEDAIRRTYRGAMRVKMLAAYRQLFQEWRERSK
jgi:hypothetical protein